jgi:hypothetical protein
VTALVLALTLLALPAPAPEAQVAGSPTDCGAYPEKRVFLESQAWWQDPGSSVVRHVHSGTCFPYKQTLNGQVRLDVQSLLHNYTGEMLRFVRVQAASDQGGVRTLKTVEPRAVCSTRDCTFTTPITVDVSSLPAGTYEFRIQSERRPGIVSTPLSLATNGWLACVKSCAGVTPQAVDAPQTEGRGYYKTKAGSTKGYINARFVDALPWNPTTGALVPKSGQWCPNLRTLRGAGDEPVESSFVTVDPRFHAVPEDRGRIIVERAGTINGGVCIDTTKLADGDHKVLVQSHWEGADGGLWGSLVVPFRVDNAGAPPPPTEPPPTPDPAGVTLTQPPAGAELTGTTIFDATAPTGATRVEYRVDGTAVASDNTPATGFDEAWSTAGVANGAHSAVARARTADGRTIDSAPVGFSVAN